MLGQVPRRLVVARLAADQQVERAPVAGRHGHLEPRPAFRQDLRRGIEAQQRFAPLAVAPVIAQPHGLGTERRLTPGAAAQPGHAAYLEKVGEVGGEAARDEESRGGQKGTSTVGTWW